jgi:hypothetical protein
MFWNFYVGSGSRTPELYSVSPDWFEYCFIYEKYVFLNIDSTKLGAVTILQINHVVMVTNYDLIGTESSL